MEEIAEDAIHPDDVTGGSIPRRGPESVSHATAVRFALPTPNTCSSRCSTSRVSG
jgi:hypothetical protein